MSDRAAGFALLIVLWTMGFLALLGTRIVTAGRSDTRMADDLKQEAVLEAAADGAISQVMFQMMAARDPSLQTDGSVRDVRVGATSVLVRIEQESDRINLNTASGALLRALMIQLGAPPAIAGKVAAAILGWRANGATPGGDGASAADYRAAGRGYGPPGEPFQSVEELADVLGMTPDLFARMAPHLTVLSDADPDLSTRDPIVAKALTDVAGVADVATGEETADDQVLRISATALGGGPARFSIVVVASADFQNPRPHMNILLRERGSPVTASVVNVSGAR
ncbi:MAG TPA: hypothetical protein VGC09_03595 [Rhodopila sp.]